MNIKWLVFQLEDVLELKEKSILPVLPWKQ